MNTKKTPEKELDTTALVTRTWQKFAWLIEGPGPCYLTASGAWKGIGGGLGWHWTQDYDKAIRFDSQEQARDAMAAIRLVLPSLFQSIFPQEVRPVEHGWSAPPSEPDALATERAAHAKTRAEAEQIRANWESAIKGWGDPDFRKAMVKLRTEAARLREVLAEASGWMEGVLRGRILIDERQDAPAIKTGNNIRAKAYAILDLDAPHKPEGWEHDDKSLCPECNTYDLNLYRNLKKHEPWCSLYRPEPDNSDVCSYGETRETCVRGDCAVHRNVRPVSRPDLTSAEVVFLQTFVEKLREAWGDSSGVLVLTYAADAAVLAAGRQPIRPTEKEK